MARAERYKDGEKKNAEYMQSMTELSFKVRKKGIGDERKKETTFFSLFI